MRSRFSFCREVRFLFFILFIYFFAGGMFATFYSLPCCCLGLEWYVVKCCAVVQRAWLFFQGFENLLQVLMVSCSLLLRHHCCLLKLPTDAHSTLFALSALYLKFISCDFCVLMWFFVLLLLLLLLSCIIIFNVIINIIICLVISLLFIFFKDCGLRDCSDTLMQKGK